MDGKEFHLNVVTLVTGEVCIYRIFLKFLAIFLILYLKVILCDSVKNRINTICD